MRFGKLPGRKKDPAPGTPINIDTSAVLLQLPSFIRGKYIQLFKGLVIKGSGAVAFLLM